MSERHEVCGDGAGAGGVIRAKGDGTQPTKRIVKPTPTEPAPADQGGAAASATRQRTPIFTAIQLYRSFRYLWIGTVATMLGQWLQNIALGWYMLDLTNSAFWVGLIGFAVGIPYLLVPIPAGAFIDRADERKVLIASQWAAMSAATLLAVIILLDIAQPWHLLVVAVFNGTAMAVNQMVRQTFVPSLVPREHLANAVSLSSAGGNAMRIIGPSIAGVIIGTVGVAACFLVQALALGGALLSTTRIERIKNERGGVTPGGILDGVREVRRNPALGSLMLLTAVPALLVFPYIQLMPVFARDVFDIGAGGLGLLMVASGVGALAGALVAATLDRLQRKGLAVMTLTTVYCLAIALFAASPWVPLAMVGLFLGGIFGSIFGSLSNALMLLLADARVRGRVMGLYMLTNGFTPFGALILGGLAESIGTQVAVAASSALSALVVGFASPRMTRLRDA